MSDLSNLLLLLVLGAIVGLWLKLSGGRERAVREARQQCQQHGLQLLDETVGLRGLRLRRINGLRRVERCYGFEVSIDGHDRAPGRLWMIAQSISGLSLPTIETGLSVETTPGGQTLPPDSANVLPFRPRANHRLH